MSYTSNVTLGTIYSDLDLSQPDRNAEVYYNGIQADDVAVTRNNSQKISSSDANDKLVGGRHHRGRVLRQQHQPM